MPPPRQPIASEVSAPLVGFTLVHFAIYWCDGKCGRPAPCRATDYCVALMELGCQVASDAPRAS